MHRVKSVKITPLVVDEINMSQISKRIALVPILFTHKMESDYYTCKRNTFLIRKLLLKTFLVFYVLLFLFNNRVFCLTEHTLSNV